MSDDLRRIVEEEIRRVFAAQAPAPEPSPTPPPTPEDKKAQKRDGPPIARWLRESAPEPVPLREPVRQRKPSRSEQGKRSHHVPSPADPEVLSRVLEATPSRVGVGRTGTRYLTEVYLRLRADHAVAKDAVQSELSPDFAQSLGCLALKSCCTDRQEFLLYPQKGRRLDADSEARLKAEGTHGADIQLIVGDGLSAWAAQTNGPELVPLLQSGLTGAGYSVGRPLLVRFARVGIQDHIGVLLGAKATLILLGERPGLGTGDSLSIYLAYGPKLDQDNAEKNCISNVRPLGIRPPEAAREAVEILRRAFAQGHGGVALG